MALSVPLLVVGAFEAAEDVIRTGAVFLAAAPLLHLAVVGNMLWQGRASFGPRPSE